MKLSELYWHHITLLHFLLWPLSLLFGLFIRIRKLCYWLDFFPSVKLAVPVIVVDSVTIEDSGKTPLISWLVDMLRTRGLCPGIIVQGSPDNAGKPEAVTKLSDPTSVGGKAQLLAKRFENNCSIWVGGNPADTAQALLKAHPDCNVIICTYGLQYPRLERDFEIAVVDFSESSFGNGLLMPAGPLQTKLKYLHNVDAVVINDSQRYRYGTNDGTPTYQMKLVGETVYNLSDFSTRQLASMLRKKNVHAVATDGNTQCFFNQLQRNRFQGELYSLADDHHFAAEDFSGLQADAIIMPEEDALQCKEIANNRVWVLPIEAWISGELQAQVLNKLREKFADAEMLNELICPHCKCQLRHQKLENTLICDQDNLVFPIKDGIPVLQLRDSC